MTKRVWAGLWLGWLCACGDAPDTKMSEQEVNVEDAGPKPAPTTRPEVEDSGVSAPRCECDDPQRPLCLPDSMECVACTEDDTSACAADRPYCDAMRECVECREGADCADSAGVCEAGTCRPCEEDAECGEGLLCDEGRCVQCALGRTDFCVEEEQALACDVRSGACSSEPVGSAAVCEPCVSDEHCAEGLACVVMPGLEVEGQAFCQPRVDPAVGCVERPYVWVALAVPTLGGDMTGICTLPDHLGCPAILSYGAACGVDEQAEPLELDQAEQAATGSDALCGALGGLCVNIGSEATSADYRCTLACGTRDTARDDFCPAQSVLSEERVPRCVVPADADRAPFCGF